MTNNRPKSAERCRLPPEETITLWPIWQTGMYSIFLSPGLVRPHSVCCRSPSDTNISTSQKIVLVMICIVIKSDQLLQGALISSGGVWQRNICVSITWDACMMCKYNEMLPVVQSFNDIIHHRARDLCKSVQSCCSSCFLMFWSFGLNWSSWSSLLITDWDQLLYYNKVHYLLAVTTHNAALLWDRTWNNPSPSHSHCIPAACRRLSFTLIFSSSFNSIFRNHGSCYASWQVIFHGTIANERNQCQVTKTPSSHLQYRTNCPLCMFNGYLLG